MEKLREQIESVRSRRPTISSGDAGAAAIVHQAIELLDTRHARAVEIAGKIILEACHEKRGVRVVPGASAPWGG